MTKTITLIPGDGVGPEVTTSAKKIIAATGAQIQWEECSAGATVFKKGIETGVPKETIESIERTKVVLKGPLETPVGFGEKSANVTLRKLFETFGNIRPVHELPGVQTPYSGRGVDLIVVRENVEDLYAGIEHMQTPSVAQCLKKISNQACEKIVRLAFEVARAYGRKKVHCATKANIMKLTEGLLKKAFERVAKEYTDIESHHIIVDNCAHQLVKKPEQFEIIVTTNMNGDILSDLTSALIGGLGFAPSANLGKDIAIFEAVHGSAPKYAGKNTINPLALIYSSIMMLRYLGMFEEAQSIENSIVFTLEEGKTKLRDFAKEGEKITSTSEFTDIIIKNLGKTPKTPIHTHYKPIIIPSEKNSVYEIKTTKRKDLGIDVFMEASNISSDEFGISVQKCIEGLPLTLKMVAIRGTKVFPKTTGFVEPIGEWWVRCMLNPNIEKLDTQLVFDLLNALSKIGSWVHIEKLYEYDGTRSFTKAQGED